MLSSAGRASPLQSESLYGAHCTIQFHAYSEQRRREFRPRHTYATGGLIFAAAPAKWAAERWLYRSTIE